MRRADRLFQIIQILRRRSRVTTAQYLAQELEVSVRTVYRDVCDLVSSGVPVEGEAGIGYILRQGYDLPPLMFNTEEIEALVLGAQIVKAWADPELARAAVDALAKVEAALPDSRKRIIVETALSAPSDHWQAPIYVDLAALRRAIRERRRVRLEYSDESGASTQRVIRPLALAFYGPVWVIVAWCELRNDFRRFRADRMAEAEPLKDAFQPEPGKRIEDFLAKGCNADGEHDGLPRFRTGAARRVGKDHVAGNVRRPLPIL